MNYWCVADGYSFVSGTHMPIYPLLSIALAMGRGW